MTTDFDKILAGIAVRRAMNRDHDLIDHTRQSFNRGRQTLHARAPIVAPPFYLAFGALSLATISPRCWRRERNSEGFCFPRKTRSATSIASGPEIRTNAIAPSPCGLEIAAIVWLVIATC